MSGADPPRRTLLVVCTANRCRSPMAHGLLAARAARDAVDLRVVSAGTWAEEGLQPTEHAREAMAERGIDIAGIRSTEVTADLVSGAYLIVAMTADHRAALESEFPAARGKTWLFSELAGGSYDIDDPIGGSLDDYRATADQLERLIDAGWPLISSLVAPPAPRHGAAATAPAE